VLWPEPDLPRTSTGKVRRKAVAAWLQRIQAAAATSTSGAAASGQEAFGASSDWLLTLIAQITGEAHPGVGDELRLTEDLHLDSLGRVQLAAAIEERLGIVSGSGLLEEIETLGDLRGLVAGGEQVGSEEAPLKPSPEEREAAAPISPRSAQNDQPRESVGRPASEPGASARASAATPQSKPPRTRFIYPQWPWWKPVEWIRIAFIETAMRPLVWLLANPRVKGPKTPLPHGPLLIVANHVTTFDGPLVQYALEGRVRRHIAAAMLGEMLEDYRHWRDPDRAPGTRGFFVFGPPAYWLITALFNVFPLPRRRDFQTSFAHAGKAMDRGYSVLVFPEGTRSAEGRLAPFRTGIGLLARECGAPVLPVAIRGLGELKTRRRRWFRSGTIEVRVGEAILFGPQDTEAGITTRLHAEVERLLDYSASGDHPD
jgi:long-chain acyl-CoA synthetase